MVGEATADCHDEEEQVMCVFSMIQDGLDCPFATEILGVEVSVVEVDVNAESAIVAVCTRGKERIPVPILDLPLPSPRPDGWEWIEAYRHWRGGG